MPRVFDLDDVRPERGENACRSVRRGTKVRSTTRMPLNGSKLISRSQRSLRIER